MITDESESGDTETAAAHPAVQKKTIVKEGNTPLQIFNVDESGLFFFLEANAKTNKFVKKKNSHQG